MGAQASSVAYVNGTQFTNEPVETLAAMSSDERWKMGLRARRYIVEHHDFTGLARRLAQVLRSALALSEELQNEAPNIDIDGTAATSR